MENRAEARSMVAGQIRARGITDRRVLDAMEAVPRHEFAPPAERPRAYGDHPLRIGHGQTMSQPYVVAWMTELLSLGPDDEVLEVGAGCGYQTAVLARLCRHVWALERIPELASLARANLARAGVENATVSVADGSRGMPERAPFSRILVAAAALETPPDLVEQLAPGGRLVLPVGSLWWSQEMTVVERDRAGRLSESRHGGVAFVPLVEGN